MRTYSDEFGVNSRGNDGRFSLSTPLPLCSYSPECVEVEFCELGYYGVLGNSPIRLCEGNTMPIDSHTVLRNARNSPHQPRLDAQLDDLLEEAAENPKPVTPADAS